jgi:predicted  nucleic acid-binding Zn-ribbon protein
LESLSGVVEGVTTNIGDNYVSNEALESALEQVGSDIDSAKAAAVASSKGYTDTQIVAAKKYADDQIAISENTTNGLIEGVASDLDELEKTVAANKKDVADNYVSNTKLNTTVSTLEGKISDAKKAATDASSAYTDTQIAAAKEYSDGKLTAATATLNQTIQGVDSKVTTLSGDVHTTIANVQTALTKTINDKVAVAYRYAGSCTYAELPTSGSVIGEVWNVTDANGNFPAGTNYAWDGNKWDALGGSIDLSPYAKTEDVNKKIETINQTNTGLQSAIDNVSAATKTLVGEVSAATVATYATKDALQTAENNITTAYTKAVGDAKADVYTSATTFANNAVTAATATLNQTIQGVGSKVNTLSASTVTIQGVANSAVQTATTNNGVVVKKNGTSLDFDFDGLVIDCGDF